MDYRFSAAGEISRAGFGQFGGIAEEFALYVESRIWGVDEEAVKNLDNLKWYVDQGMKIYSSPVPDVPDSCFECLNRAVRKLSQNPEGQQFIPLIEDLRTLAQAIAGDKEKRALFEARLRQLLSQ